MAHRTIDKNNGSPARGRSAAVPEEQQDTAAEDLSEPVGQPSDDEPESVVDETGEEDLRIAERPERAVMRRATTSVSPEAGVPQFLMRNSITRYLAEVYIELRKVTWPSWHDAWNMALIVIGMSLVVAAILGAADIGLTRLVTWVFSHSATPGAAPTPTPLVPTR